MWPTVMGEGSDLMGLNLVAEEGGWTGAWTIGEIWRCDTS